MFCIVLKKACHVTLWKSMFKKQRNCSTLGLWVHNSEEVTLTLVFGSILVSIVLYYFTLLKSKEIELLKRIYCFPKICCDNQDLTQNSTVICSSKIWVSTDLGRSFRVFRKHTWPEIKDKEWKLSKKGKQSNLLYVVPLTTEIQQWPVNYITLPLFFSFLFFFTNMSS